MNVTRIDQFGLPILCVHGELGEKSCPEVLVELISAVAEGHTRIGLDLSSVTSMGQSQAGLLAGACEKLARGGSTLSLVGLSPAAIEAMAQVPANRRSPGTTTG